MFKEADWVLFLPGLASGTCGGHACTGTGASLWNRFDRFTRIHDVIPRVHDVSFADLNAQKDWGR